MNRFLGLAVLALLPSALATDGSCNADNCARAVTGTRRGDAFVTSAQADCSAFQQKTITAPAVTITSTVAPPWYASACSGTVRYASACSCWGIQGEPAITVTPTTTITTTLDALPTQ
ncbi:hypothetical protein LEL_06792 [Akanthomyces lecanii RCEF 1005]|uniref:Uncharacterized protein n=2 Tax=Akanthomyces TaxID=150366 RepID=A0A162KMG0_CORDF|nr:hypothetical protein LEL_06792 [Akanthomyces lecanii RCEF 1005]